VNKHERNGAIVERSGTGGMERGRSERGSNPKKYLAACCLASGGFVLQFCVIAADPEGLVQKV
jgi:hypothetical protein